MFSHPLQGPGVAVHRLPGGGLGEGVARVLVRLRWVLAVALAFVCVWPAGAARADTGYWIPPSWVETAEGSGDARGLLGVGSVPVSAFVVSGGADPFVDLFSQSAWDGFSWCGYRWGFVSGGLTTGPVVRVAQWADRIEQVTCADGVDAVSSGAALGVTVRAADGWAYAPTQKLVASAGDTWVVEGWSTIKGLADLHGGVVKVEFRGVADYRYSSSWDWLAGTVLAETVTELWCRGSGTGVDTVISESAQGVTVAPAPVCPDGSFPVRVRVTNTVDGVVVDASITAAALSGYADYLASPAGWSFGLYEGGYPCIPGDPSCIAALEGTWDEDLHECVLQGPGGQWVPVDASVCQDAWDEAQPVIPGSSAGDDDPAPESVDAESIVRAVQRAASDIVSGVKRAIDSAVAGVKAGIAVIQSQLDGTNTRLDDLGEAVRDLPAEIAQSVADGIASIFQPGQATADSLNGIVAAMGVKFAPWRDVGIDLMMGFGEPCQCAVWHLDLPGLKERLVLFNSCAGYGLVMATAGRVGTTAVIYVSTVAMCVKFVAGSVSYVSFLK